MVNFAILLPSAEGKRTGGNPFAPDMFDYRTSNTFNYFSDLNPERRTLIRSLQAQIRDADDAALEKLFGIKGDTLAEAVKANEAIFESPLMAVIDRYSPGVMYQAMRFSELPTGAQRRLLENGIVFSGLFGALRPDDLIPEYRLKMDARLDKTGKVSHYWRPHLSPLVNQAVEGKLVWDLLPGAHRDAWEDDESYSARVEVKFYRERGGERKAVTHGVKELRGALVHFVVSEVAEAVEDLDAWDAPEGFEVDYDASELPTEEEKSGTVVMIQFEDWEERRAKRLAERAAAEAEANAPDPDAEDEEEDDEDESEEDE